MPRKKVEKVPEWKEVKPDSMPEEYDLVKLQDSDQRVQFGWWTGKVWDFGKQRIGEPVKWLRTQEGLP